MKNQLSVFCLLISFSVVFCAPYVDVSNDHRPILDVISPNDELPIAEKERATNIEVEGIPSKGLSIYDQSQLKFKELINSNAEPIVDTIQEHEKYGNDGDRPFDRAFVNGLEAFSNFVNKLIDTPKQIARSISGSITEKLNQVGGTLVGL